MTVDLLEDILGEIEKHRIIWNLVEVKSVVAILKDGGDDEGHWHNFGTLITMLQSGSLKPWKKHVEKDNFAILSAVITLDHFKKNA